MKSSKEYHIEYLIEEIGLELPITYTWIITSVNYIKNKKYKVGTGARKAFYDMVRFLYYTTFSDLSVEEGVITLLKEFEEHLMPSFETQAYHQLDYLCLRQISSPHPYDPYF